MTAIEFRVKSPANIRLRWLIYGHHIELQELQNFTEKDLIQIYQVDDRKKIRDHITLIFQANVWNTENLN